MSAEAPSGDLGDKPDLLQVMRLLYNLPAEDAEAERLAELPLEAASRLPLKQDFSPDRFDPLPPGRPPASRS